MLQLTAINDMPFYEWVCVSSNARDVEGVIYIYKHTSRRCRGCCCSVCRCWAGWWWLRALRRCVFVPSSDARTTAAPSVCGWIRETWVRRRSQTRELQTPEWTSLHYCAASVRSAGRPALLAAGALPVWSSASAVWRPGALRLGPSPGRRRKWCQLLFLQFLLSFCDVFWSARQHVHRANFSKKLYFVERKSNLF